MKVVSAVLVALFLSFGLDAALAGSGHQVPLLALEEIHIFFPDATPVDLRNYDTPLQPKAEDNSLTFVGQIGVRARTLEEALHQFCMSRAEVWGRFNVEEADAIWVPGFDDDGSNRIWLVDIHPQRVKGTLLGSSRRGNSVECLEN